MKNLRNLFITIVLCAAAALSVSAQGTEKPKNPNFDAELAKRLGADESGMRNYIFVMLKTGPKDAEIKGKERDDIFKGHFANINRLAGEGKLVVAGPFDGLEGLRGMFIFNVETIDEAKALTGSDPVIKSGILVPEYHKLYCTAALIEIGDIHKKLSPTN
jgi:uncharacterized protein YciI